jgi:hypothetical protein
MPRLLRVSIAILVVTLTCGAAMWAYGQGAQGPQFPSQQVDPAAMVLSGNDVGFRVDRQATQTQGKLTGTWVVRVNGQWVEPQAALRGRPLSTR